jgi:hypothetical protein
MCKRKRSKDSCLDIAILLAPELEVVKRSEIVSSWNKEHAENKFFKVFREVGKYSNIDLEFVDGHFNEGHHSWTSGPDEYELEIGNFIAYSKPLFKTDDY